ncbi:MAG: protein translocase subunit SecD, partial [Gemmatimonadota bacterium]|nr:protein translocase subunit SecD [Gemmatimonadota bacterium]
FGLDLQGGTYLSIELDDRASPIPAAERDDALDQALTVIRTRIDELGVAEPTVQRAGNDRIIVELAGRGVNQDRAKEIIQRTATLQFQIVRDLAELQTALPRMDRALLEAGAAAPADAARPAQAPVGGLFQTAPDTAAADTAATVRPLSSKLVPGGSEGLLVVASGDVPAVERYLALPQVQRLLPRNAVLRWGVAPEAQPGGPAPEYRPLYLLEREPLITGDFLVEARAQSDPLTRQPVVAFQMNRQGGRRFARGTGANIGNLMAIVLDNRVFSAPVIQGEIGTNGQITLGGASLEEARDLALVLRAGALKAPIRLAEERSVGPSLGADSVERGQIAGIIAIVLILGIILFYYRVAGVLAVTALSAYVLFVLGGLSGLGATLTLPGIAGIVLSIGMAVDANILIFERIREELDNGRAPRAAVSEGFGNALSAIVDSNLTTLLTALVLFQFGTGPVRGFAVTLGIGIVASMFTAIFITRTLFMIYLERRPASQPLSI